MRFGFSIPVGGFFMGSLGVWFFGARKRSGSVGRLCFVCVYAEEAPAYNTTFVVCAAKRHTVPERVTNCLRPAVKGTGRIFAMGIQGNCCRKVLAGAQKREYIYGEN